MVVQPNEIISELPVPVALRTFPHYLQHARNTLITGRVMSVADKFFLHFWAFVVFNSGRGANSYKLPCTVDTEDKHCLSTLLLHG